MPEHRPFRFGVLGDTSPDAWVRHATRAEVLGYDVLTVGDHVFSNLASITALASAAMVTSTIRLGSLTFGNDFRNPLLLAKEMATIDALSGGRVEFGLGSGFYAMDYNQTGIAFDPPETRVERLEEAITLIKAALTQDVVHEIGRHFTVSGFSLVPSPAQQPHPPLVIGGGSRRVLTLAAREANIVSINIRSSPQGGFDWSSISPEATARKVRWVREAAKERFSSLELQLLIMRVDITDDPRGAAQGYLERSREMGSRDLTVEDILSSPHVLFGTEDEIVDILQRRREEYGISYFTVFAPAMEEFGPIVSRLSGT